MAQLDKDFVVIGVLGQMCRVTLGRLLPPPPITRPVCLGPIVAVMRLSFSLGLHFFVGAQELSYWVHDVFGPTIRTVPADTPLRLLAAVERGGVNRGLLR